jgi:hypothetical protein
MHRGNFGHPCRYPCSTNDEGPCPFGVSTLFLKSPRRREAVGRLRSLASRHTETEGVGVRRMRYHNFERVLFPLAFG